MTTHEAAHPERNKDGVKGYDAALAELVKLSTEIQRYESEMKRLSVMRRNALVAFVDRFGSEKTNLSSIARNLHLSRARLTQIVGDPPRPTQFLGLGDDRAATVVIGSAPRASKKPDAALYAAFQRMSEEWNLSLTYEHVRPGDVVDLNRSGLIVASGPRVVPAVHTVLQSDKKLTFTKDKDVDGGLWCIKSGGPGKDAVEYRSYIDAKPPEPIDIGYLGRRPRPDGDGTFICISGIHVEGTIGVVHYLLDNLRGLQNSFGRRPFSTLIRTDFDETSRSPVATAEIDTTIREITLLR